MGTRVTAIMIASNGSAWLDETIPALRAQTRQPDRVIAVDNGSTDESATLLQTSGAERVVVSQHRVPFGAAIRLALGDQAAPVGGAPSTETDPAASIETDSAAGAQPVEPPSGADAEDDADTEWLWFLSHDTAPEPDALERILATVQRAPSVAVAGPKLLDWFHPERIVEMGQSLTRTGARWQLNRQELDQQQYDDQQDTLGVGPAGMLVRRDVWEQLGGFDPALPVTDDGLDFSVRARLAGYRVVTAPDSRVRFGGEGVAGPRISRKRSVMRTGHRQSRAAQLHRRLAYAPAVVAPLHWLSLPFIAVFRLIWSLIREQPGRMIGEVRAALGTFFRPAQAIRARRRIAANNTAGWAAVRPLRVDPKTVRTRRMIDREAILAKQGRNTRELHFISTGGLAVILAVFAVAIGLHWWLFGAGSVSGGGIAPLGASVGELWSQTRGSGAGPADPFAWVLALLGTLTFWSPSLSVVLLVAAAMPLAAFAAWVLAAQFTQSGIARALAAIAWAASPVLLSALDSGRLPTILLGVLLPWALLAALRARSSWSWAGLTSLVVAAVLACAPVLLPAAAVLWLVGIVSSRRGQARVISTAIVPAALFAPLAWVAVTSGSPLSVLADPGLPLPFAAGTERHLAIGFPEFGLHSWGTVLEAIGLGAVPTTLAVGILLAPLALLALIGLYVTRVRLTLFAGLTAALGLATALVSPSLQLITVGGEPLGVWPGSGLALYWLGLVLLAASGLSALGRAEAPIAVLTIVGVVLAVLPLLVSTVTGQGAIRPDGHRLPAVVRAAAASDASVGTLVLTAEAENGVRATVERGEGTTLGALRTSRFLGEPSAAEQRTAELTGVLASAGDGRAAELLAESDIEFVLLTPGGNRATAAELQAAFDQNGALSPVGETASGDLWRISAQAVTDGAEVPAAPEPRASIVATPIWLTQIGLLLAMLLLALPTGEVIDRPEKRPSRRAQQRARLVELRAIERAEAERVAADRDRERDELKAAKKAARKAERRGKRGSAASTPEAVAAGAGTADAEAIEHPTAASEADPDAAPEQETEAVADAEAVAETEAVPEAEAGSGIETASVPNEHPEADAVGNPESWADAEATASALPSATSTEADQPTPADDAVSAEPMSPSEAMTETTDTPDTPEPGTTEVASLPEPEAAEPPALAPEPPADPLPGAEAAPHESVTESPVAAPHTPGAAEPAESGLPEDLEETVFVDRPRNKERDSE